MNQLQLKDFLEYKFLNQVKISPDGTSVLFGVAICDEEKNAYIKENPDYGRIVCRCEQISEGEIRDAIRRNPQARDMDGVKRRTRSGMGRCQGGFCGPYVMELLAREMGIAMEEVTKNGGDSAMLIGRIGEV